MAEHEVDINNYWCYASPVWMSLNIIPEPKEFVKVTITEMKYLKQVIKFPPIKILNINVGYQGLPNDSVTIPRDVSEIIEPLNEFLSIVKVKRLVMIIRHPTITTLNGIEFLCNVKKLDIKYEGDILLGSLSILSLLTGLEILRVFISQTSTVPERFQSDEDILVFRNMDMLKTFLIQSYGYQYGKMIDYSNSTIRFKNCPNLRKVKTYSNCKFDFEHSNIELQLEHAPGGCIAPQIVGMQPKRLYIKAPWLKTYDSMIHLKPRILTVGMLGGGKAEGIEKICVDNLRILYVNIRDNVKSYTFLNKAQKLRIISIRSFDESRFMEWNSTLDRVFVLTKINRFTRIYQR
jgi:hypothetical protein